MFDKRFVYSIACGMKTEIIVKCLQLTDPKLVPDLS